MIKTPNLRHGLLFAGSLLLLAGCVSKAPVQFERIAAFDTRLGRDSAEITCYDQNSQRLFVTNSETASLSIVDFSEPAQPRTIKSVD